MNKKALLFAAAAVLAFASDRARARPANILEDLTGFASKETCSCAFVVEQTDAYCKAFGQVAGFEGVDIAIDRTAKTVTASVLGTSRTAAFADGAGCVTDALP